MKAGKGNQQTGLKSSRKHVVCPSWGVRRPIRMKKNQRMVKGSELQKHRGCWVIVGQWLGNGTGAREYSSETAGREEVMFREES